MAKLNRSVLRDNAGRFQKYATVYIDKALEEQSKALQRRVQNEIKDELEQTYISNVIASYTPRTDRGRAIKAYNEDPYRRHKKKLTYRHTGIFVSSIYTKVEGRDVKVMIRDEKYPDGASTTQVYEWLTKGTQGGDKPYPYIKHKRKRPW